MGAGQLRLCYPSCLQHCMIRLTTEVMAGQRYENALSIQRPALDPGWAGVVHWMRTAHIISSPPASRHSCTFCPYNA